MGRKPKTFRKPYATMTTEEKQAFNRYNNDVRKRKSRLFSVRFWYSKDKRIIERLECEENVTEYIRSLILNDIKGN